MPGTGRGSGGLPVDGFDAVMAAVDAANSEDPNTVEVRGRSGPKELLHSELMTEWVRRLQPDVGEVQLVAARAHHLRRWEHPRTDYPSGRAGYLRWRAYAKSAHAAAVGEILRAHGASEGFVDDVGRIVRKDGLGSDPAVQLHEDALCLVFLETQLDDLIDRVGAARATEVLRRTVMKMSAAGLSAAAELPMSALGRSSLSAAKDAGDGPTSQ